MKTTFPPVIISGNDTSLWGRSNGNYAIDRLEVTYVNWISYPKDLKTGLHASVNVFGTGTEWQQYTDKAIEKNLNGNASFMAALVLTLQTMLKKAGIRRKLPTISVNWSEQGMQPNKGWNFDVGPRRGA